MTEHSDRVDTFATALDLLREGLDRLDTFDDSHHAQALAAALEIPVAARQVEIAALAILDDRANRLSEARPALGEVGERVRALPRSTTGRSRWNHLGTITEVIRPGIFRVTFVGDDESSGGVWGASALTTALVD